MKITFVLSVSISAVSSPLSQMSHACKYGHGEVLATLWHGHLYLTPDITITRNQDKKYLSPLIFFLNAAMKISRLTRLLTNNTLPPWQKTCWAISQFLASYLLCLPRKKCIFFANSKLPSVCSSRFQQVALFCSAVAPPLQFCLTLQRTLSPSQQTSTFFP